MLRVLGVTHLSGRVHASSDCACYDCTPLLGAYIAGMAREEPVVALVVFGGILKLTVLGS
jgi:hypothetical protein